MENTEQLRSWISRQVDSTFEGNLAAFAQKTKVSRQTWMNILNHKYRSLRQQAVSDLCALFGLSEIELYLIAHPSGNNPSRIEESSEPYRIRDDEDRLAEYIRNATEADRDFIFNAAERCGFMRRGK